MDGACEARNKPKDWRRGRARGPGALHQLETLEPRYFFTTGIPEGINLTAVSYYDREWAFADAMQMASDWASQPVNSTFPFNDGRPIALDAHGWPLLAPDQAAAALIFRDTGGHYPAGAYSVTWQGTGSVTVGFDAHNIAQGN